MKESVEGSRRGSAAGRATPVRVDVLWNGCESPQESRGWPCGGLGLPGRAKHLLSACLVPATRFGLGNTEVSSTVKILLMELTAGGAGSPGQSHLGGWHFLERVRDQAMCLSWGLCPRQGHCLEQGPRGGTGFGVFTWMVYTV